MTLEQPDNLEGKKDTTADAVATPPAAEAERGAVKKKIDIPGVGEIEYTEKTIMFPEKIVQETGGVRGYIRKMVSWEELLRFWDIDESEWEKIKAGQIYHSREELEEKNKKWLSKGRSDLLHSEETLNKYPKKESIEKFNRTEGIKSILLAMTNGEFINQTLNHIINRGGKVHPIKGLVADIDEDSVSISRCKLLQRTRIERSNVLFDLQSNKIISGFENRKKLEELGKSKDTYILSHSGLNLTNPGKLWTGYSFQDEYDANSPMLDQIILGLKLNSRNKILRKYCRNVSKLMKKQKGINDDSWKFYRDLIYRDKGEKTMEALLDPVKYFKDEDYFEDKEKKIAYEVISGRQEEGKHPYLPVVVNYPDIPELRLCHADYAAIPTKNGYNIIEMIT